MTVAIQIIDRIAIIALSRKEAMNALNEKLFADLNNALDEVEKSHCRGVVFIGAGDKAFCAGADIVELQRRSLAEHRQNVKLGQATFNRIARLGVPSVAVIHGFAFGGGLELALACTFRIATAKAKMGLPELKLGLIPGYGGTQRLPRLIGEARALDLILSGRVVGAEEALQMGLINRIVEADSPAEAGEAYLKQFTPQGMIAMRLAQEAIRRGLDGSLEEGLAIEADLFSLCSQSGDAAEGMAAFLEKRAPEFRDC
ncbi:MAG: enoyl-CoA hydratase/isomerase family protein [Noviherbaspirillum sp.]